MEGADFHEHQPESPIDVDGDDEVVGSVESHHESDDYVVPTEAEKDAVIQLREIAGDGLPRPAAKGVKRPRPTVYNTNDEVPDLAEIFDNYDTPAATRISICRAYASYVASTQPKKPKAAPRKRK